MKKVISTVLFYLGALLLILKIHKLSPTNMAGLGFDLVVYVTAPIISIGLLAKSMIKEKSNGKTNFQLLALNLIGSIAVILLVIYEMNKKN